MSNTCGASLEDDWGPRVATCRRSFDFTLLFEQSVLTILPAGLFVIISVFRLLHLWKRPIRATIGILGIAKIALVGLLAALQLALVVLRTQQEKHTRASVASSAVSLISSLLLVSLSFVEHSKTIRPSILITLFLIVTILLDLAQVRTLWLLGTHNAIAAVFSAAFAIKFVLLGTESVRKKLLLDEDVLRSPEDKCGLLSRSFFLWVLPLMVQGFKTKIGLSELYPPPMEADPILLEKRLLSSWDSSRPGQKHRLLLTTFRTSFKRFIIPVIPRLLMILFTILQPVLLGIFIPFINDSDISIEYGYGLIGAYAIVYIGLACSNAWYEHQVIKFLAVTRAGLVSLLYNKTMRLDTAEDKSSSVTMMSTDIERIVMGLKPIHDIWANVVQVGISAWLLEQQIGVALVFPLVLPLVCTFGATFISGRAGKQQARWMGRIEKRLETTTQSLSSTKGIKLSGLTRIVMRTLQGLRDAELADAAIYRWFEIASMTMAFIPMMISPVLAFAIFIAAYGAKDKTLDAERIFVALSYLLLISQPLSVLLQAAPSMASMLACFGRIEEFLSKDEMSMQKDKDKESTLSKQEKTGDIRFMAEGIGWGGKEGKHVLRNVDVTFCRGKTTMILGPVGCGKTTLLKALLGEVPDCVGSSKPTLGSVSYCEQTPWLINGTVNRNITMFSNQDDDFYDETIRSCALMPDILQLARGDQSQVGSGGVTLSGGQKQRICLARAIYARREVNIFDDVLSGLDSMTQRTIMNRVFGPQGLLKKDGTQTTIVATHSAHLALMFDHIICLGPDGEVSQQGSFDELVKANGYLKSLDVSFMNRHQEDAVEDAPAYSTASEEDQKITKEESSDELETTKKPSGVYRYWIKAIGPWNAFLYALLAVVYAFLFSFPNVWAERWASANEDNPGHRDGYYVGIYAMLQVLCLTSLVIFAWHAVITIINSSGSNLHFTILTTTFSAPLSYLANKDNGVILNKFSQDLQLVDNELPMAALDVACSGLIMVGQLVLIINASYWLALAFPAIFGVLYVLTIIYLQTSRQMRHLDLEYKSPLYTHFTESTQGLASIRAYDWQADFKALLYQKLNDSQKPFYLMFCIQKWLTLVLECLIAGYVLVIVGLVVGLRSSVSAGFLGVAMSQIVNLSTTMTNVVEVWVEMETSIAAIQRIRNYEKKTPSEQDRLFQRASLDERSGSSSEAWPTEGAIFVQNLKASYQNGAKVALKGVNMTIKAGQKVGICGRSGGGKSSLMLAFFRMIDFDDGSIHIDGQDISKLDLETLRNGISAVPQDPFFLSGTVRENADPHRLRSDEEIEQSLSSVRLAQIVAAGGGLDAEMATLSMSQGQRQLFCLARAMLRKSKIVIMDEATSSIDVATEKLIKKVIREKLKDYTVITIAHRLDLISDDDMIAVMDAGEVVEYAAPQELLRTKSRFRELYSSQRGEDKQSVEGERP